MILNNIGNVVMYISVILLYDTIKLIKRVTCDIIKRYHVELVNWHDGNRCGYGVYVLKWW